jgi:ectoine hydroxylase-related dioxygenase (phytanoyl-CoA dioxygenase family)
VLKAGQVSFHHSLTFHGSGPNLSDQPRRCVILHMMPAGCGLKTDGKWHLCATLLGPEAKKDQPFSGPFFPRLWPPGDRR